MTPKEKNKREKKLSRFLFCFIALLTWERESCTSCRFSYHMSFFVRNNVSHVVMLSAKAVCGCTVYGYVRWVVIFSINGMLWSYTVLTVRNQGTDLTHAAHALSVGVVRALHIIIYWDPNIQYSTVRSLIVSWHVPPSPPLFPFQSVKCAAFSCVKVYSI